MTTIGVDGWELILKVIGFAFTAAAFAYAHVRSKNRATEDQIKELEHKVEAVKLDQARIEARLDDAPTTKVLHELAVTIEHLSGELRANNERLEGVAKLVARLERVVERQENHLLNRSG